eukprot:GHVQ01024788.1.p1 GENE.GHVQ01024788.1~~GHVQ01024788.1.p1  ORF type:complete len:353 (-),score=44.09 GHVQ01024788.1:78-1136(-)
MKMDRKGGSDANEKLNSAILYYLHTHFPKTYQTFLDEASLTEVGDVSQDASNQLLRRWVATTRLQLKISQQEKQLSQLQEKLNLYEKATTFVKAQPDGILSEPSSKCLSGHRRGVTCLAFHPIIQLLFSASEDATIKVWDYEKEVGGLEATLRGHTDSVTSICFNTQSNKLASCSADTSIRLWDIPSYECSKTLQGHENTVSCVRFMVGLDVLISSSRDKTVKLWNVTEGHCIKTIQTHTQWVRCVSACPLTSMIFASAGHDKCVYIHFHPLSCLSASPIRPTPLPRHGGVSGEAPRGDGAVTELRHESSVDYVWFCDEQVVELFIKANRTIGKPKDCFKVCLYGDRRDKVT